MAKRRSAPKDALAAALVIAGALGRARIRYAVGGALAYGFYGVARGTHDVDLNVFVDGAGLPRALDVLERAGVTIDRAAAADRAAREGLVVGDMGGIRIDVFVPSIPFSAEAERTRVQHTVRRRRVWFLSAEALAVFKVLFFRGKDQVDLERMCALMGPRLDVDYVRRHIVDVFGADDERIRFWDRISRPQSTTSDG